MPPENDQSDLLQLVLWPEGPRDHDWVRETLDRVRRFIDFDGTIAEGHRRPRDEILGTPLAEFLAEEPFIVQTWNPGGAKIFFEVLFPDLPKPEMVVVPELTLP